jgi:hypothetical protein
VATSIVWREREGGDVSFNVSFDRGQMNKEKEKQKMTKKAESRKGI